MISENLHRHAIPSDGYHSHEALAFSQLARCGTWTPDEEQWTPHLYREPIGSSAAMDRGTLVHAARYEPERFHSLYAVRPMKNGRNVPSDSKEFGEWSLANAGRIVVSQSDLEEILAIADALTLSPVVSAYVRRNAAVLSTERAYLTRDPATGLALRIKPDCLRMAPDGSIICEDLKTTRATTPKEFRREAEIHAYYRRFALYRHALSLITDLPFERIRCVFIAVGNDHPHPCWVAEADPEKLDAAQTVNDDCMTALSACIETGVFAPKWAREAIVL